MSRRDQEATRSQGCGSGHVQHGLLFRDSSKIGLFTHQRSGGSKCGIIQGNARFTKLPAYMSRNLCGYVNSQPTRVITTIQTYIEPMLLWYCFKSMYLYIEDNVLDMDEYSFILSGSKCQLSRGIG